MAWAKRGKSQYYYRSRRIGNQVIREYLGSGLEAELSARLDVHRREQRRDDRDAWVSFVCCVREADRLLEDLNRRNRLLASVILLVSGWYSHKGEWRRRRVYRNRRTPD
jgi:hypothetical protein